ncbi:MAG: glycosyltransferase [Candidatus Aenigmarchaeota archaeon]|nr:glycosyltransferase [Candidatus Aenigmarchaeota archaeon]
MRIGKFATVGASGILVNEFLLLLLTEVAGLYFLVSSVIAIETAIITNFFLNNSWTFSDRREEGLRKRFAKFNAVSLVGMAFNVILLYAFTEFFGIYYMVSNVMAIFIVFVWNYFANMAWTWSFREGKSAPVKRNPLISVIIPTYNERENMEVLVPEIFMTLSRNNIRGEVIVVDDNSPDGTWKAAEKMKKMYNIKVVRRKGKMGLSSAVLKGMGKAEGDIIGVMDADFSHPPEIIPELVEPIMKNQADMTVGSRKIKGGGTEGWPLTREIISWGASLLAKPLTSVKDPMSGFFFFKRGVTRGIGLNPTGYKIGLEIMVKGNHGVIKEIPFVFRNRRFGKSKLTVSEDLRYLFHLIKLYWFRINR